MVSSSQHHPEVAAHPALPHNAKENINKKAFLPYNAAACNGEK
jgi:hypothetical protein